MTLSKKFLSVKDFCIYDKKKITTNFQSSNRALGADLYKSFKLAK